MSSRAMSKFFSATLIALMVSCVCAKPAFNIPHYIECVDSSDCARDECCTIGMGRFTIPVCRRMLEVDELCHPERLPFDTSVSYPDGNAVNLTNVYINFCPCLSHLTCSSSNTCTDPTETADFNYIDDTNFEYAIRIDY